MRFAQLLAKRSTCRRAQVGCVVVTDDNCRVLAVGYNGGAKGVFNDCLSDEPGKCGHLHAEVNALIKLNYNEPARKKLYTTTMPCLSCAVAIINACIHEVIYLTEYRLTEGVKLLEQANVCIRKYNVDPIYD
jgi:dCMP deaminase